MKTNYLISLLLLLVTGWCEVMAGGEIWVSTNGSDTNVGSKDKPLKTPGQALRMAREWRRLNDARTVGGITIHLADGSYFMEEPLFIRPEDSGTESSPTIITSNGDARLSGGIPITDWKREGKFWTTQAPMYGHLPLLIRQLWRDGEKCLRASQMPEGKMLRMLNFDPSRHTITIPTPSFLKDGAVCPQMEMNVHQRWAMAILRISSYQVMGDSTIVSFCMPESRTEFEHPWPQPVIGGDKGNSSFCLTNALCLVDEPKEWYQDYATGKIYYYAQEGDNPNNHMMIIPAVNSLIVIAGTAENPVHHISINNLKIEYSAWNRPGTHGHVTLQGGMPIIDAYKLKIEGLPWAEHLENQAWIARPENAVSISWAHHINFNDCTFRHLAATALDAITGVNDIKISGNHFEDIGGSAILAGSFAEGSSEVHRPFMVDAESDAYCKRILISGNTIHNATNEDWGCVGIGCGFVRDTEISYNTVDHVNYSGICVGWGWTSHDTGMRNNRIHHNKVSNFALQLYDAGGIYTLSSQPGSEITNNIIEGLGEAPYATNDRGFYIYLDEATDGYTIDGNHCPEKRFGDNKPGPSVIWGTNGPDVK